MAEFSVTGVKELDAVMKEFTPAVQKQILRSATRQAAKPVMELARAWAPHETGALERSIKVRALKRSRKNKDTVGARVVTSESDNLFQGDQFYGAFQEFGTKHMPANPYLAPAMAGSESTVRGAFQTALPPIVETQARRLAAKANAK